MSPKTERVLNILFIALFVGIEVAVAFTIWTAPGTTHDHWGDTVAQLACTFGVLFVFTLLLVTSDNKDEEDED